MVPRRVVLWDGEFPRLGNGKLDRQSVIEQALKSAPESPPPG